MTTKFQRGVSGNAAGRPKGSVSKLRAELAKEWPEIKAVLIEQAKGGDLAAIRLVAERVCAPLRAIEVPTPFALPEGTLTEKADAVIKAMAAGDLATAQASQILQGLGALGRLKEMTEFEDRLKALEARL